MAQTQKFPSRTVGIVGTETEQPVDRVDWLVRVIGNEIVTGALKAGEKISEPRLSRQFGISRGPLREAIRRLEERQLVVRTPNFGARVASFTTEDFVGVFHVREGLEGIAARLAAARITDPELTVLEELCARHARTLPDSEKAREVDLEFHFRVAQASGSPVLTNMLCDDFYAIFKICRRQARRYPGRAEKALHQHLALLEALTEHDPEHAEYIARRHVRDARRAFEKVLHEQGNAFQQPDAREGA